MSGPPLMPTLQRVIHRELQQEIGLSTGTRVGRDRMCVNTHTHKHVCKHVISMHVLATHGHVRVCKQACTLYLCAYMNVCVSWVYVHLLCPVDP